MGTVVRAEPYRGARTGDQSLGRFWQRVWRAQDVRQLTRHYTPGIIVGRQVAAVVNFPPKQIGKFMSEIRTGFPDAEGEVVLVAPIRIYRTAAASIELTRALLRRRTGRAIHLGVTHRVDITAMCALIASDGKAKASSAGIRVAGLVDDKTAERHFPLSFRICSVVVDGNFDVIAPTSEADPDVITVFTSIRNQVVEATAEATCLAAVQYRLQHADRS